MSLLDSFPREYEPRPIQKEILAELESAIRSGHKKIILCSPTGVGKSLVGATLARYFGSSFMVTASKHLQDQYTADFGFLRPVKGKSNFACLKMMQAEKESDPEAARNAGLTCEKGVCMERRVADGVETEEPCSFKPKIGDVEENRQAADSCHYYLQKYAALVSPHSLWNYHSYFQILKYSREIFEKYLDRDIAVFDEAHRIEDQIIQFVGTTLHGRQLDECKMRVAEYNLDDVESVASVFDDISGYYAGEIRRITESRAFQENPDYDVIDKLEKKYEEASRARIDLLTDPDNFVIDKPQLDDSGRFRSLSIKPVSIKEFVSSFFGSEHQLFMSATIDKKSFCENTGIPADSVALIDTPKSPFPPENRSVQFLNIARLNYRATPEDEARVIQKIHDIMELHSAERGLVLTSSIYRCNQILQGLPEDSQRRVRICHSINPGNRTQTQVLEEHADDPRGVLLSSSLWEGVDLKDDLSRFQIVAKVPYPNMGDRRVKAKMESSPLWYTSQTLTKLLQGFGRSVRGYDDHAKTYVLDSAVLSLLQKAGEMIPSSYRDILVH